MRTLVFADCIEGWQECQIIKEMDFRAVVKTQHGTTLTRFIKEIKYKSELIPDGCIYVLKGEC